jgi:hypothetical protein
MKRRGLATVTALVAVAVAGCTSGGEVAGELRDIREVVTEAETDPGGDEPGSEAEEATEEPGASAESPEPLEVEPVEAPEPDPDIDITTVPDEITLEYVQAVLDELERIYASAVVMMMEEGELTIEITDHIGEVFTLEQRDVRLQELLASANEGFEGFVDSASVQPNQWVVKEVLEASPGCMWIESSRASDGFLLSPPPPAATFVLLEWRDVERPVEINPTPWVIGALRFGNVDELRQVTACE